MYSSDRNPKVLAEQLDELQTQFSREEVAIRGLLGNAKRAERKFTPREQTEFDAMVARSRQTKSQLQSLRNELEQTQNTLRNAVMERHPSATVYGMMNSNRPTQVLKTEHNTGEPRQYTDLPMVGRLKAFRDPQAAFDAGMWYRAVIARECNRTVDERAEEHCRAVGLQITNTATEGSGVGGGYTVPAPLSTAIIEVRERVGVARQVCNVLPMTSDTLTVPKKTGGLTVYVVNEGQSITDSDKTWGSVAVAAKKRACIAKLSQELSQDSIVNMVDNLVSEQGYALALQEDDELLSRP